MRSAFFALAVGDHAGAPSRGELDEHAARDSAGSVDDDPAAALDRESLVERLSRSECRFEDCLRVLRTSSVRPASRP